MKKLDFKIQNKRAYDENIERVLETQSNKDGFPLVKPEVEFVEMPIRDFLYIPLDPHQRNPQYKYERLAKNIQKTFDRIGGNYDKITGVLDVIIAKKENGDCTVINGGCRQQAWSTGALVAPPYVRAKIINVTKESVADEYYAIDNKSSAETNADIVSGRLRYNEKKINNETLQKKCATTIMLICANSSKCKSICTKNNPYAKIDALLPYMQMFDDMIDPKCKPSVNYMQAIMMLCMRYSESPKLQKAVNILLNGEDSNDKNLNSIKSYFSTRRQSTTRAKRVLDSNNEQTLEYNVGLILFYIESYILKKPLKSEAFVSFVSFYDEFMKLI